MRANRQRQRQQQQDASRAINCTKQRDMQLDSTPRDSTTSSGGSFPEADGVRARAHNTRRKVLQHPERFSLFVEADVDRVAAAAHDPCGDVLALEFDLFHPRPALRCLPRRACILRRNAGGVCSLSDPRTAMSTGTKIQGPSWVSVYTFPMVAFRLEA